VININKTNLRLTLIDLGVLNRFYRIASRPKKHHQMERKIDQKCFRTFSLSGELSLSPKTWLALHNYISYLDYKQGKKDNSISEGRIKMTSQKQIFRLKKINWLKDSFYSTWEKKAKKLLSYFNSFDCCKNAKTWTHSFSRVFPLTD